MTETKIENKKLVISTEIYIAVCNYQVKVDRYTALTNDDYETDFMYAFQEIENSAGVLDRLLRSAQKV